MGHPFSLIEQVFDRGLSRQPTPHTVRRLSPRLATTIPAPPGGGAATATVVLPAHDQFLGELAELILPGQCHRRRPVPARRLQGEPPGPGHGEAPRPSRAHLHAAPRSVERKGQSGRQRRRRLRILGGEEPQLAAHPVALRPTATAAPVPSRRPGTPCTSATVSTPAMPMPRSFFRSSPSIAGSPAATSSPTVSMATRPPKASRSMALVSTLLSQAFIPTRKPPATSSTATRAPPGTVRGSAGAAPRAAPPAG